MASLLQPLLGAWIGRRDAALGALPACCRTPPGIGTGHGRKRRTAHDAGACLRLGFRVLAGEHQSGRTGVRDQSQTSQQWFSWGDAAGRPSSPGNQTIRLVNMGAFKQTTRKSHRLVSNPIPAMLSGGFRPPDLSPSEATDFWDPPDRRNRAFSRPRNRTRHEGLCAPRSSPSRCEWRRSIRPYALRRAGR